jgi:processive 1,2-diacylglycerol beta-glucosyltransferase
MLFRAAFKRASEANNRELVELFLGHGADIGVKDNEGKTTYAIDYNYLYILDISQFPDSQDNSVERYSRMHRKIKVLSAAAGAGHVSAANALVSAFSQRDVQAQPIEVLKYTNALFRKAYSDIYKELCTHNPDMLGWIYKTLDQPWKYRKRRIAMDLLNTGRLIRLFMKERPEVAICTHFLPAEILLFLRRRKILDIPVGIVITDYDAHAMWLYNDVKWYFVAHNETKAYLEALGIAPDTIHVTGIPVDLKFGKQRAKEQLREELELQQEAITILVSAGGFGVGPVEEMVRSLQKVKTSVQIVVICGRNPKLEEHLKAMPDIRHPTKIVGYTSEMHRWMAASDVLVGKAGGLTSSEALASGLVLVIVNPIPGQEERNSDHFLEEGVAIRCNDIPILAYKIDSILSNKERFSAMKESVRIFAKPNAAADIVSIVLEEG